MADRRNALVISVGKGEKKQIIQEGVTIKVQGKPVSVGSGRGADLVFVIDTTGSMSDKIDGLLATSQRFVDEFVALGLSQRVAVVAFGDLTVPGDEITVFNFAEDIETIKRTLVNIPRYSGGGNLGESSLEALAEAMALPFRGNAVKAVILITDEPALQHGLSVNGTIHELAKREILTFVVSPSETYFQEMARATGGRWYEVSSGPDFTNLLEIFRGVAVKVSQVVSDVYRLGSGSVSKYLQLKASSK